MAIITPDWLVQKIMNLDSVDAVLLTFITGKIVMNVVETVQYLLQKGFI